MLLMTIVAVVVSFVLILESQNAEQQHEQVKHFMAMAMMVATTAGAKRSNEDVEKSIFSIWVDLFLCRSTQLLVLSYAEMFVYMYLSQLMSTFTNYHKGVSSSRWCLHSMTRRTSDPIITHIYLYTRVPQI